MEQLEGSPSRKRTTNSKLLSDVSIATIIVFAFAFIRNGHKGIDACRYWYNEMIVGFGMSYEDVSPNFVEENGKLSLVEENIVLGLIADE